jgi:tetratricopeptide (TPR) repeat protein
LTVTTWPFAYLRFKGYWTSGLVCGRRSLRSALRAAPDYADAMFNLALLLQRNNKHAEAAEYWRRYLANDAQSEWAARARRALKFCEMQMRLSAS